MLVLELGVRVGIGIRVRVKVIDARGTSGTLMAAFLSVLDDSCRELELLHHNGSTIDDDVTRALRGCRSAATGGDTRLRDIVQYFTDRQPALRHQVPRRRRSTFHRNRK